MLRPLVCGAVLFWLAFGRSHSDDQAMTVGQLSQYLAGEAQHDSDDALALRLNSIHLSECLTPATLAKLEDGFHLGPQARESLQLLADASGFLVPPPNELPDRPAPGAAEQQAMLKGLANFVSTTMRRLPDFFATRTTETYDNAPTVVTHSGWAPAEPMHVDGMRRETITYRQGREVTGKLATEGGGRAAGRLGLTSSGEFGPLLATILADSSHGKILWSHWESTGAGVAAVFAYDVPKKASHYNVDFCCVKSSEVPNPFASNGMPIPFHGRPAYHGEIFLDPASGAVLRITLETEMKSSDPITRAAIAIDYGPVTIEGDKSYICPVRSLALSVADAYTGGENGPRQVTRINEVSFTGYHRFGSTIRVIGPAGQP